MEENKTSNFSLLKRIITTLTPPPKWRFPVIIFLGIITGLGFYILHISNAVSYLSDDPRACINCHIMNPEYITWTKSSHGRDLVCNDCHVPQDSFVRKYYFKAMDGLRHATMFTFRLEPQVIQIKQAGKDAVQENCIRCHQNNIHPVAVRAITSAVIHDEGERYCWDCHRDVPHGKVHSLSSTPNANVPALEPVVPEWLKKFTEKEKQN